MSYRVEHHPPAEDLTINDLRDAEKLLEGSSGLDFRSRFKLDPRSRQKIHDYRARMRMVPGEVLEASDAVPEEKRFFLGDTSTDPEPFRKIRYYDLTAREEIEIPYSIDVSKPVTPEYRQYRPPTRRGRIALAFSRAPYYLETAGTLDRQMVFKSRVNVARETAVVASDASFAEIPFLKSYDRRHLIPDPMPDHEVIYRALVPASEVIIHEN